MSENHNGMDETHPTSPRTLATPTRFLVAARAPQRTSPTACPREANGRNHTTTQINRDCLALATAGH